MEFFHALAGDMGVDLGGGQVTVTQQQLNDPQICTVIQQVGCKSVTQRVWRQLLANISCAGM